METEYDWLPGLVLLSDYDGNWDAYLDVLYSYFHKDFVDDKPTFPGKRVGLKRYPLSQGKEATFWHFISTGKTEEERIIDLRRCERIRWPRPIIEAIQSNRVKTWSNTRKRERRVIVALPDFSYIVVLADRGDYVLPLTAYFVKDVSRRRKLEQEYHCTTL